MEILIVAMLMTVVVKRGVEDVWHTARGNPPQRYVAASARKKSGAAGRYWSALWDDTWSDLHKRHVTKRSDPSRPRGAATVFWSNLWRDGWIAAERRRQGKATRPRPETVTVPGSVVPDFEDEQQDGPGFRPGPDPHVVPTEDGRTDLRFGEDEDDPTGVSSCPECGGTAITEDGVCLSCRDRQEQRNQHHEQQEDGIDDHADPRCPNCGRPLDRFDLTDYPEDGKPVASLQCMNCDYSHTEIHQHQAPIYSTPQEGSTMTTTMPTDTEVVSLSKAIHYSESTARVAAEMVNSLDFTQSSLAAGGVTGIAVDAFASAKEKFGGIATDMEQAAAEFKAQLAIQEAYNANPGAGSKEFIMGGR